MTEDDLDEHPHPARDGFIKKQYRAAHAMLDKLEEAVRTGTMKYVTKANLEIPIDELPTLTIVQFCIPPDMGEHKVEPFEHKLTIVVDDD